MGSGLGDPMDPLIWEIQTEGHLRLVSLRSTPAVNAHGHLQVRIHPNRHAFAVHTYSWVTLLQRIQGLV